MACELLKLKSFLYCFSLETGARIIAWLGVIISSLELVTVSVLYTNAIQYVDHHLVNQTAPLPDSQDVEMNEFISKVLIDLLIAGLCFWVVFNVMLVFGVYKKNTCLMIPWLIVVGISCGLCCLYGVASILMSIAHFITLSSFLLNVSITILSNAIQVYFFLVIYSFYNELKKQRILNENTPLAINGSSYYHYHVIS